MMQQPVIPSGYTAKSISYTVPSATREGLTHTVTRLPGKLQCDCEAGRLNRPCWHVRSVLAGLVKPHVKLSAVPVEKASELLWN